MEGIVMDIQKFCLHDGPGIRTTVFLKGCNMGCIWCHNPESMECAPILMYKDEKCLRCGACVKTCLNGVHVIEEDRHVVYREKCTGCGLCVRACKAEALVLNGKLMDSDAVMEEIIKDEKYYAGSGGGITFSGGEATLQFDFLLELLKKCKDRGYQTAVETNGLVSSAHLRELNPYIDLYLLDYKATGADHERLTGVPVKGVLNSLCILQELSAEVHLRCPMIPGINDTEEHFKAIRDLRNTYSCIRNTEVMAYHDIGKGKWEECGKPYALNEIETVSRNQKQDWEQKIRIKSAE